MPESTFLIRNQELENSQDFAFLREAGIRHIEALAHELWTDYNVHDPGITLLEVLCYGITDLGYRTSHDLKDLLTQSEKGVAVPNKDFHQAREILTCSPVTFDDLRKMLVDIKGVRHAWIEPEDFAKYCLDKDNQMLLETSDCEGSEESNNTISLNGLYSAYIEYEEFVDDLKLGLEDNESGKGRYERLSAGRMRFSVERELVIRTVHIYGDCKGEVVIHLLDQDGKRVLKQRPVKFTLEHTDVKTAVDVNFLVVPPTDPNNEYYVLEARSKDMKLYMNPDVEYCFEIDDLIELMPDSDKAIAVDNYYFFYDWVVDFPEPGSLLYPPEYSRDIHLGPEAFWGKYAEALIPNGQAILFNVEKTLTLEAVHVFGNETGEVNVIVKDFTGQILREKTVTVHKKETKIRVELEELVLEPLQEYRIEAKSKKVSLFATKNAAFPYYEPEVITLLGGTQDGKRLEQTYYFFYDWEIRYTKQVGLEEVPEFENTKTAVLKKVRDKLLSNRNLCQDLVCIKELKPEEVGICADVDLSPDAPVEETLAEIYYQLEEYVKPAVRFHTIEELQEMGRSMDQIFEGPKLDHGFLDDEEFAKLNRQKPLRASDIIHILMDISGVQGVRNLRIVSFIDELPSAEEKWIWCPSEDACRVPNFEPKKSSLVFYKKDLPFYANQEEALALLADKDTQDMRIRYRKHQKDLPVPTGEDMEVEDYYPVQNDLPLNYMVGQYGVPTSQPTIRKAQARQLKGYLAFFEQLFANYLSQLSHVGELFSWKEDKVQTYFTQPLDEIDALDELYIDYPQLQENLNHIIEETKTAQERKLRFQEHLMGRFAESFTDYSLLMFDMVKNQELVSDALIEDKRLFLTEYPRLSGERGMAYDYRYPEVSDNISGFKRRIYRLLGIEEPARKKIAGKRLIVQADGKGGWHFVLVNETGEIIFTSVSCSEKAAVDTMLDFALKMAADEGNYACRLNPCDDGWEMVLDCSDDCEDQVLGTVASMEVCEQEVMPYLKRYGQSEGFHLIEHILLRKRTKEDPFLPTQNVEGSAKDCIQVKDPYSFRMSVVAPAWPVRFQNPIFRAFVEETLRLEAPAHILLKICWIDHEEMREFEDCLEMWECELACLNQYLKADCTCEKESGLYDEEVLEDCEVYREALSRIIDKLHSLEQVYPAARLHDCETTTGSIHQVTLGRTNLSTFG